MTLLSGATQYNLYHIMDLLWIPVGWFAVHKHQRWKVLAFILTCLVTLRLQAEVMDSFGFHNGIMHLVDMPVYQRGLILYSLVIMLFLFLAHYSPRTSRMIIFAASLSIYVLAFCASMVLMVL